MSEANDLLQQEATAQRLYALTERDRAQLNRTNALLQDIDLSGTAAKTFDRRNQRKAPPDPPPVGVIFKNTSTTEDMPPYGIGCVKDAELRSDGQVVYLVEKPSTTFRRQIVINGQNTVLKRDGMGTGQVGCVQFLYDETPTYGQGYGAKPGSWKATRGYFGLAAAGVLYDDLKIGSGLLEPSPIDLSGVATAEMLAGTVATSSKYRIYVGPLGSEVDGGWTTVPDAKVIGGTISTSDPVWLSFLNGSWFIGKVC